MKTQSLAKQRRQYKKASPPPALDSWFPAYHQQRGQLLGHVPSLALAETPLGLESLAKPGSGRKPSGNLFAKSLKYTLP